MKKLVFMFVAIAAMSFASCNKNQSAAPATDSDTTAVDTTDSAAAPADSAAAPADTAAQAK